MTANTVPWNILSASVGVGVLTEGWTLADVETEDRDFTMEIEFATPFAVPPVVHLGLTGMDADQRDPARITLKAEEITEKGFSVVISTWASTRIHAVEFNWLAIGA